MRPETISLVRHGQSTANVDKTNYQTVTDDLMDITLEGEKQVAAAIPVLAKILGSEQAAFYTSPYLRCRRTAAILRAGLDEGQTFLVEDNHLRERKVGNYLELHEYRRITKEINAQGFFYRPPCGESIAEVFTRSELFRATLRSHWESASYPRHVVIVGHNTALKTFLMSELRISALCFPELGTIGNAQVITLKPTESCYGVQYIPVELPIGITQKQINSTLS